MDKQNEIAKKVAELEEQIKEIEGDMPGLGSSWLREIKARLGVPE